MLRGDIYTMAMVWDHYCEMLVRDFGVCVEQSGRKSRNAFRHKMKRSLQEKADFVQSLNPQDSLLIFPTIQIGIVVQNFTEVVDELEQIEKKDTDVAFKQVPSLTKDEKDTELLSWMYRVSVKMRADLNATPGHSGIGNINTENAERVVPESLYLFLRLLCGGDDYIEGIDESNNEEDDRRRKLLSIAQDIVSVASNGRKHTPKQLGLGLTIHQATGLRNLCN